MSEIHPLARWRRLLEGIGVRAGIGKDDLVAIKMHFGEENNVTYMRPTFARKTVELVKEWGGRPFLTDTTTLYRTARATLHEHLDLARKHGFTAESMGCPIIIADGLKNNGVSVDIENGLLDHVHVAQAIYDADVLISLAHVTFHPEMPLAATIKNIGMGCVTKASKVEMHGLKSVVLFNHAKCVGCGLCVKVCPGEAYTLESKKARFDESKCVGCGECVAYCRSGAITIPWSEGIGDIQGRIVEGAAAVISTFDAAKVFHVDLGLDVTVICDCAGWQTKAVPDFGILASTDPVAVDKAASDCIDELPPYPGTDYSQSPHMRPGGDKVKAVWPGLDMERLWAAKALERIGSLEYEIEDV